MTAVPKNPDCQAVLDDLAAEDCASHWGSFLPHSCASCTAFYEVIVRQRRPPPDAVPESGPSEILAVLGEWMLEKNAGRAARNAFWHRASMTLPEMKTAIRVAVDSLRQSWTENSDRRPATRRVELPSGLVAIYGPEGGWLVERPDGTEVQHQIQSMVEMVDVLAEHFVEEVFGPQTPGNLGLREVALHAGLSVGRAIAAIYDSEPPEDVP